jgi:hypothetical protein
MAFVQLESWKAAAPESRLHPFGGPAFALPAGLVLPSRRAAAGLFTILVHCALLWFLVARLSDGTGADPKKEDVLAVFNVAPPGETESSPAARLETATVAPPAAPITIDLSQPADLPPPEWTMARMPAQRAAASPAAMASAGSAAGQGNGQKGEARLSQFVGFGDGIGGEMLLDRNMLEIARRAAMRAFPDARGTALIFLRVSPSGTVMSAMVKGGSRDIGLALRRELMGKKLFQMRSAIGESALVALPPVSLGAVS